MNISSVSFVNLAIWILFGGIIGLVLHLFDPHQVRGGVFSSFLMGMIGATIGGILATVILNHPLISFSKQGLAIAIGVGIIITVFARIFLKEGRKSEKWNHTLL